jgi:hypothetical protein
MIGSPWQWQRNHGRGSCSSCPISTYDSRMALTSPLDQTSIVGHCVACSGEMNCDGTTNIYVPYSWHGIVSSAQPTTDGSARIIASLPPPGHMSCGHNSRFLC